MNSHQELSRRAFAVLVFALLIADCAFGLLAFRRAAGIVEFMYFLLGLMGLMLCPILASAYLLRPQASQAFSARAMLIILLILLTLTLLAGATDSRLIREILEIIHRRFHHPSWQLLGLTLAAIVYFPLIVRRARQKLQAREYVDFAVGGVFLLFLLCLYLPFGFNSIGHWESWGYRAYLEGQHSWNVEYELTTRFWVLVPHTLASVIAPDSFIGFHLTHLLILWAKLSLLYGILRILRLTRPHAFLTTLLFMVYPVNSDLLSLRSLPNQFSVMSLLAAAYLMLEYRERPNSWHLLGIWLGLVFNVVSNETAYALILLTPALWLLRRSRSGRQNAKLTVIWYLIPACQLAHLLLLASLNMSFYNSYVFDRAAGAAGINFDAFLAVIPRLAEVYLHTFLGGWLDAFGVARGSDWLAPSLTLMALAGAFTWYLVRSGGADKQAAQNNAMVSFVCGLLFVMPAVGVLIWLPQYSGDLWRMYFYVPFGAAIAVYSLARLFAASVLPQRYHEAAILALCLTLMLPTTARLLTQHELLVRRANSKAAMLYHLMEAVPRIEEDTVILLTTDMSKEVLSASAISELRYSNDLDNSMLFVLYGNGAPVQSTFCIDESECSVFGGENTIITSGSPELYQRTLALNIAADLSVALIEDPAERFGLDRNLSYNVNLLFDRDAPLSSRTEKMLAAAR